MFLIDNKPTPITSQMIINLPLITNTYIHAGKVQFENKKPVNYKLRYLDLSRSGVAENGVGLQTMLINNTRIITSRLAVSTHYYFSITQYTKNLLDSQFHLKGRAMPGMNRGRLYNSNIPIQLIRKIQDQLQTKRSQLPPTLREQQISSLKPENKQSLSQYTQSYLKLIKAVEPLPVTNNHVCSIIAWYNLADHYKQMFKRLLESQSQDIKILLQYLSWMNYQWNNDYGVIDSDISLGQPIRNFYKKIINLQLDIHNLQQIEAVVVGPVYYEKRRFYEIYLNRHAQTFFGSVDPSQSEIEQYVWLVQTYTKSMNDDGQVHSMMEQFLLKHKQKLKASSILKLMNIYQLTGNINKDLYEQIIKPYIYRHKMGKLGDVIQTIKFAICSECQDNQLLKTLYELVQSLYLKTKYINTSRHLYILHQYTHYLLIKGYKIKLHHDLQKNMVTFCRQRAQSRLNINHLIAAQSKQGDKYVSPCLNQVTVPVKQYEQTKQSKFQEEFLTKLRKIPFDDHTFHHKPVLCCFQLDFCLQHKQSHQIHDLQIEGLQYMLKSGKHIRQRQIRDQILKHYNIQVHHLDFSFIRNKEYTSFDDFFKRAPKKE